MEFSQHQHKLILYIIMCQMDRMILLGNFGHFSWATQLIQPIHQT
jgi:hypothetical protein